MRLPIQAALLGDDRSRPSLPPVDLAAAGSLDFEPLDRGRFPSVDLAYDAGRRGDSYPAVLNAANEEAVNAFLAKRLSFASIPATVESTLDAHTAVAIDGVDAVLEVDAWARDHARGLIEASSPSRPGVLERVLGRTK